MLNSCGHSFCQACIKNCRGVRGSMVCPQCRNVSEFHTTNYGLMSALDSLKQSLQIKGNDNKKEAFVDSCKHVDFEYNDDLDCCGHCNKGFCTPCFLAHKVSLRHEAAMIASHVSHFVTT